MWGRSAELVVVGLYSSYTFMQPMAAAPGILHRRSASNGENSASVCGFVLAGRCGLCCWTTLPSLRRWLLRGPSGNLARRWCGPRVCTQKMRLASSDDCLCVC